MSWKWLVGLASFALIGAAVLIPRMAKAAPSSGGGGSGGGSVPSIKAALLKAAGKLNPEVIASAKKWASARGLALQEVIATILLESRGNPRAHAKTSKEDSRGAMQVNVNAWGDLLKRRGYTADDLFDADRGIEIGTEIFARFRSNVQGWIRASKVTQFHSLDTLTRLAYAGPAYVQKMIQKAKTTEDTMHAFKNSETYVAHWHDAMAAASGVGRSLTS